MARFLGRKKLLVFVGSTMFAGATLSFVQLSHRPPQHPAPMAAAAPAQPPVPFLPQFIHEPEVALPQEPAGWPPGEDELLGLPPVIRRSEAVQLPDLPTDRVPIARARVEKTLHGLFAAAGLQYPPERLFIRAFKRERELELWSAPSIGAYRLVATYEIAGVSGGPGPKRREGDGQTPEGFYQIDRFNPKSNFHLSLGLNYPNASDHILSDPVKPGHDIFIHGRKSSIGCMPVGDDRVEEIFITAADTKERPIPVHVFPARMNSSDWTQWREEQALERPELLAFWENLAEGFEIFEQCRVLPTITVLPDGRYQFARAGAGFVQDLRQ
jgi:hypothetical protein